MIVFCVTLLLLHQGYTLAPVTTVQLGEPATFTCVLPTKELINEQLYWYKQSAGDDLKLIVMLRKHVTSVYGPEFSTSRLDVKFHKNISKLTILKTIEEDEGMYHCALVDWTENIWSGTYLSLTGNTQRTSNCIVVQWPTVSDPVHPEDSMTLQCSVLSDSDNKTCPGDHSVFWFRAGSDQSHPNIIYTDGNRHDECDKRSDTQKSCVYRFTKNVASSDAGTYYCAVATCGEILFGNGTKVEIELTTTSSEFILLVITIVCLVISMIGNVVFICYRTPRPICKQFEGIESATSQARHDNLIQPVPDITEGGDNLNYAALHFSGGKATRGRKKQELKTEESVYSQVQSRM
ncbi:immunoglobulin superfamily member 2-like [Dicentrarchus labrax]|uniref:Ig-like domain-containing protein n=1 Tax=Dicentrarchus labrax TaxID=13489 RepID=A0A8C4GHF4_DICLA|nr:immunoglobulin superfamily member 2-like [Dicentrarchus labrax]